MGCDMVFGCRAHDFGRLPLDELAARVADKGFGSVQLAPAKALSDVDAAPGSFSPGFASRMARAFGRRGVRIAVLGCYINPVHPDPEERRKALDRFKENLRFCRDFGCSIVATETGSRNADCSRHPGNGDPGLFETLVESVSEMAEAAEKSGSIACVEGVVRHTASTPAKLAALLDRVKSDHLQVLFDPVNFLDAGNYENQGAMMDEALSLFGDRILVLHAKDFGAARPGEPDLPTLPAGSGGLDYGRLFARLKKRKPYLDIIIEDLKPEAMDAARDFVGRSWEKA